MPPKLKLASPELEAIVANPANQECADCDARAPRWASVNLGCLVCIDCAGIHRHLGVHISVMKSVTLDKWQQKWLDNCGKLGNKVVNSYYEALLSGSRKPTAQSSIETKRSFVIAKYERKEWCPRGSNQPPPNELLAQGRDPECYLNGTANGASANGHGATASARTGDPRIDDFYAGSRKNHAASSNPTSSSRGAGGGGAKPSAPASLLDDFGDFGFPAAGGGPASGSDDFGSFTALSAPLQPQPAAPSSSIDDLFAVTNTNNSAGGTDFTAFASFPTTSGPDATAGGGSASSGAFSFPTGNGAPAAPATQADKLASFNSNLANLYSSGTAYQNRGNMDAFADAFGAGQPPGGFGGGNMGGMNANPMMGGNMGGAPFHGNGFGAAGGAAGMNPMMGPPAGGMNMNSTRPQYGMGGNHPSAGSSAGGQHLGGPPNNMLHPFSNPVGQPPGAANNLNPMMQLQHPNSGGSANNLNPYMNMHSGGGLAGMGPPQPGPGPTYTGNGVARKSGGLEDLIAGTVPSQYLDSFASNSPKNKSKNSPKSAQGPLHDIDPFSVF
ncbi:unnamed protein product [Amoebophrya sp. A120]|nr:unnamed protein product [Amoebophrya sp. A120]|eukprot:GSA120T00021637001.1